MIKPEYFDDEDLARASRDARLLGIGLLGQADRAGRLEDKPARLKLRLMPYDDDVDAAAVDAWLNELQQVGYLVRYEVGGRRLIWIRTFTRHQHPHKDEQASTLPPYQPQAAAVPGAQEHPTSTVLAPCLHDASTVPAPCEHRASTEDAPHLPGGVRSRCTESESESVTVPRAREAAPAAAPTRTTLVALEPTALEDRCRVFLQETYPSQFRTWRHGAHYRPKEARVFPATMQLLQDYQDDAWLGALVQLWLRTDLPFAVSSDRGIEAFIARASWCDDKLREAGFSPAHLPTDDEIGPAARVGNARASPRAAQRAEDAARGAAWAARTEA